MKVGFLGVGSINSLNRIEGNTIGLEFEQRPAQSVGFLQQSFSLAAEAEASLGNFGEPCQRSLDVFFNHRQLQVSQIQDPR